MSDETPPTTVAIEKEKTRRRLISLGELLAVLAVIISALGLFNNWSERRASEADRIATDRRAEAAERRAAAASSLLLTAHADGSGSRLDLSPARDGQIVQAQMLSFPSAIGISPVETSGAPRIDAAWFASPLKKARRETKHSEAASGDERLPVLVETTYVEDGETRRDRALYDIGYAVSGGGLFGGSEVRLRGISLVARDADTKALEARWRRLFGG